MQACKGCTALSLCCPACPCLQPLDVSALFQGKEPLLKLQLTHCSDGGCILGATLPHLLAGEAQCLLTATKGVH